MADQDGIDSKRARRWRRRKRIGIATGAILLAAVATFWCPLFQGNFGVVAPGLVYRSAQPGIGLGPDLAALIAKQKVASILNLRGGSEDDAFYADEVRLTRQNGVDFYDFPMSATRRPTRRELLVLLELFGRCRYPILIHCKQGADRTGLASGFYLMGAGRGVGPDLAVRQLTIRHGHVGFYGTERLREPFVEYDRWLKARGLSHTPERLRLWVENDYLSDDRSVGFRPLRPGPREVVAGRSAAAAR